MSSITWGAPLLAGGPPGVAAYVVLAVVTTVAVGAVAISASNKAADDQLATSDRAETCQNCTRRRRDRHWHHEMPQQFRDRFARAGFDIDAPQNGRVMPQADHLSVHGRGYNRDWAGFFQQNPNASAGQINGFRNSMVQKYNLNAYPRPSGRYNII